MCGGTGAGTAGVTVTVGLSPRVRGNQHGGEGADLAVGSIPACAGEPIRGS